MPALETMLAALGGLVLGAGALAYHFRGRERAWNRERLEIETKMRRDVIPVLERRADVLGIPPRQRGQDSEGPVALVSVLAVAIRREEESGELPFGDTLEVSRTELQEELGDTDGDPVEGRRQT